MKLDINLDFTKDWVKYGAISAVCLVGAWLSAHRASCGAFIGVWYGVVALTLTVGCSVSAALAAYKWVDHD